MISAIKKLVHSDGANQKVSNGKGPTPVKPGLQTMGQSLQRRFAKGVQYNMKIILKGDRNVGKTTLFHRLQGQKFLDEYIPTQEIQVASIQWSYKATDDIVKVEVWDVVDKGKKKKKIEGLKLDNEQEEVDEPVLDADFLDVYKGTNGVILLFDITKQWTFDYIQRELPKIPDKIPVLILANHRDMGHHRVITQDEVVTFVHHLERPSNAAKIRCAESSMRNGFGLKFIHKFFNFPFLQLQRESLLQQLETNLQEIEVTNDELDIHEESEEQNYDLFLDALTSKRRANAEQLSKLDEKENVIEAPMTKSPSCVLGPGTKNTSLNANLPKSISVPSNISQEAFKNDKVAQTSVKSQDNSTIEKPTGGFMSRIFSKQSSPPAKENMPPPESENIGYSTTGIQSVDEFVPDDHLDGSFLDDNISSSPKANSNHRSDDDDDSSEEVNPMVAGFQDEIDSGDDFAEMAMPNEIDSIEQSDSSEDETILKPSKVPVVQKKFVASSEDESPSTSISYQVSQIIEEPEPEPVKLISKPAKTLKIEADSVKPEQTKSVKKSKKRDKDKPSKKKSKKKDKEKKSSSRKSDMDALEEFLGSNNSDVHNGNSYEPV